MLRLMWAWAASKAGIETTRPTGLDVAEPFAVSGGFGSFAMRSATFWVGSSWVCDRVGLSGVEASLSVVGRQSHLMQILRVGKCNAVIGRFVNADDYLADSSVWRDGTPACICCKGPRAGPGWHEEPTSKSVSRWHLRAHRRWNERDIRHFATEAQGPALDITSAVHRQRRVRRDRWVERMSD